MKTCAKQSRQESTLSTSIRKLRVAWRDGLENGFRQAPQAKSCHTRFLPPRRGSSKTGSWLALEAVQGGTARRSGSIGAMAWVAPHLKRRKFAASKRLAPIANGLKNSRKSFASNSQKALFRRSPEDLACFVRNSNQAPGGRNKLFAKHGQATLRTTHASLRLGSHPSAPQVSRSRCEECLLQSNSQEHRNR